MGVRTCAPPSRWATPIWRKFSNGSQSQTNRSISKPRGWVVVLVGPLYPIERFVAACLLSTVIWNWIFFEMGVSTNFDGGGTNRDGGGTKWDGGAHMGHPHLEGAPIRWGCAQMGVAQMGVRPDGGAPIRWGSLPQKSTISEFRFWKIAYFRIFFADYRLAEKQCGTLLFPTSSRFIL